jgi:hypothetical protein
VPIAFTMMFWEDQSYSQASMDVLVALKKAIYPPGKVTTTGENRK